MKIGLPTALLYQFYGVFWFRLFKELGFEIIMTQETTKAHLNKATKYTVPDLCLPIKIFVGHVLELMESDVDYIYVPRMISIREGDTFCPKFLGLPDLLKYSIPNLEARLLTHHVTSTTDEISAINNYDELQAKLGGSQEDLKAALGKAAESWKLYRQLCYAGCTSAEAFELAMSPNQELPVKTIGEVHIGVLGYVYNVYDNFVSQNIIAKLRNMGASCTTFEMLEDSALEQQLRKFRKPLFWTFSNKLLASAYHFFEDTSIDGVIHVTAFGCGPDSFMGKVLQIDAADRYNKPFMTLRVDEHTGENHLDTRLEAFVDMLIRRKQKRGALA